MFSGASPLFFVCRLWSLDIFGVALKNRDPVAFRLRMRSVSLLSLASGWGLSTGRVFGHIKESDRSLQFNSFTTSKGSESVDIAVIDGFVICSVLVPCGVVDFISVDFYRFRKGGL